MRASLPSRNKRRSSHLVDFLAMDKVVSDYERDRFRALYARILSEYVPLKDRLYIFDRLTEDIESLRDFAMSKKGVSICLRRKPQRKSR